MEIAIIGAGLVGRILTIMINQKLNPSKILLIDKGNYIHDTHGCGYVAGGMISPYSELTYNEKCLLTNGIKSLNIWPTIIAPSNKKTICSKKMEQ